MKTKKTEKQVTEFKQSSDTLARMRNFRNFICKVNEP